MKSIINKLNQFFFRKQEENQPVISSSIDTPPPIQPHEWFTGNYPTFQDAMNECIGYDAPNILEKVKDSLLKVKKGEAVYERDSCLFDQIQYSLPLLVSLLYVATSSKNKLNVIDFGGSLGSSYFQNRNFLTQLNGIGWSIVEQKHFVKCGKEFFQDETLKFYDTIFECKKDRNPNTILLSSVLPYLPNPYSILEEILSYDFQFIIIDRTPFFVEDLPDRITIEHVPPEIYDAKYPSWFFNEKKFMEIFESKYTIKEKFQGNDNQNLPDAEVKFNAILFERK